MRLGLTRQRERSGESLEVPLTQFEKAGSDLSRPIADIGIDTKGTLISPIIDPPLLPKLRIRRS
jgi:hypothetical protein